MTKAEGPRKGRMIHIRLDDKTHRHLKVHAARGSISIQQLVEGLIRQKLIEVRTKDEQL